MKGWTFSTSCVIRWYCFEGPAINNVWPITKEKVTHVWAIISRHNSSDNFLGNLLNLVHSPGGNSKKSSIYKKVTAGRKKFLFDPKKSTRQPLKNNYQVLSTYFTQKVIFVCTKACLRFPVKNSRGTPKKEKEEKLPVHKFVILSKQTFF